MYIHRNTMTKKQLINAAEKARKCGRAILPGNDVLYYHGPGDYFALYDNNNNCIACAYNIDLLFDLCD